MPIIRRRRSDEDVPADENLYRWVMDLPQEATVHVRKGSAYVGSFTAYEIQQETPAEEYLMERYGPGAYELSGHTGGVFLAGRHTVIIGSYEERQVAQRRQSSQDTGSGADMVEQVKQWAEVFKTFGLIPAAPASQGQDEIVKMLVQNTLEHLRPADPAKTMGQAADLMKSMNEFKKATPQPRAARPRKSRPPTKPKNGEALAEALGTALFIGADLALRHPGSAQRLGQGFAGTTRRLGDWVRRSVQTKPHHNPDGAETSDTGATSLTLDQAIASVKAMAQTPTGQLLLTKARNAAPNMTPEEVALKGLAGAREWLSDDHPLLVQLRTNPGKAFDEIADLVGLDEATRAPARGYFIELVTRDGQQTSGTGEDAHPGDNPPEVSTNVETATQADRDRPGHNQEGA